MKTKITLLAVLFSLSIYAQERIEKDFSGVDKIKLSTGSGDCILMKSSDQSVI